MEQFKKEFLEAVKDTFPTYHVELTTQTKTNNLKLEGFILYQKDTQVHGGCVFYWDSLFQDFQQGIPIQKLLESIQKAVNQNQWYQKIAHEIMDFSVIKSSIYMDFLNTEWNTELLSNIPHLPYADLQIAFYIQKENMTIRIHNRIFETWKISIQELYQLAIQNCKRDFPVFCKSMQQVLAQYTTIPESIFEKEPTMYIITNVQKQQGTSIILYTSVLKELAQKENANLYLIPSSVHEWIVVNDKNTMDQKQMAQMIQDINQTEVLQNERLSDHLYYYDAITDTVTIAY